MKCVSIYPPWAPLVAAGIKPVENRGWETSYRGPLLIHASKTFDGEAFPCLFQCWQETCEGCPLEYATSEPSWRQKLARGAIIGQAELVDCVRDSTSEWAAKGSWHWMIENAKLFDEPVPYPGRQGLFEAPDPDAGHLFKPHDGKTRRVCVTQEPPDVMITRPGKWGNPWTVKQDGKDWAVMTPSGKLLASFTHYSTAASLAVNEYRRYLESNAGLKADLAELKGKRLGCFCKPGDPCHGDVLAEKVREVCGE